MISYVSLSLVTPCWWMPDWCRKAFRPTMALLGWTVIPVRSATRRLVRVISRVLMPVVRPKRSFRVWMAITTSSREAFPARSPMPFTQTSTCRAPARTAARELATARPRSLWQWTERVTFSTPRTFS